MIPRRKAHIIKEELFLAWSTFFDKGRGQQDAYLRQWQDEFARFAGVKYVFCSGSGRQAMRTILEALELKNGDEVIIPTYTLKDLAAVIAGLGLKPVCADIDRQTFNISLPAIKEKITARTKVILATHLFGSPCAIEEIILLARERAIFVVEDCAHCAGAEVKARMAGSFGDAAFFSTEVIKPLNTYGGGLITTSDAKLADNVRRRLTAHQLKAGLPLKKMVFARLEDILLPTPLSWPGLRLLADPYWHEKIYSLYRKTQSASGGQKGFSGFQARVGLEKLKSLAARNRARQAQAFLLRSLLDEKIKAQLLIQGSVSSYYFFVALLPEDAGRARKFLLKCGIDAGIHDEIADDCARELGFTDCPEAADVFSRAIQLPLHEGMTEVQVRHVAESLNRYIRKI